MFSSVLVANRGEIAVRVMRTCARLGVRTVAVYADPDARAPHVRAADTAVRLGPGPAAESYLRGDLVIAAARSSGADAIHPGYGFLAEQAAFAEAVIAAGLAWIGPPPAAMRAVGDKASAKAIAQANDVPILQGYHGPNADDEHLRDAAGEVGYPLLVKASAGGGGRGMRLVRRAEDLPEALAAARREAASAFGDDRLLLERYVERPRHVEIQLLADRFGNLVHLGERECSIQRRHQKLIEESPSPAVGPELRAGMGDAALRLARAAGYEGAGTCEFLLDEAGEFFFLEVNARLQVEHPVTEAVTSLDLVEQQLRIAAGERLGFEQGDVRVDGHAMEVRVVAEDPRAGFLPSTGRVTAFHAPGGVRTDTGIESGSEVSPFYDSLLAKVIAHGPDRAAAIDRLADALDEMTLGGVETNIDLLAAVLADPSFRAGELHTGFLEEHRVVERLGAVDPRAVAAAAAVRSAGVPGAAETDHPSGRDGAAAAGPWSVGRPWRVGGVGEPTAWVAGGRQVLAEASRARDGELVVSVDGVELRCRVGAADVHGEHFVQVDAAEVRVRPAVVPRVVDSVTVDGVTHRLRLAPPPSAGSAERHADGSDALSAPMPGRITRVHVAMGDVVAAGDPLLVLEAMKMEHVVAAPAPGSVARIVAALGEQVPRGALLVELDPIPGEGT